MAISSPLRLLGAAGIVLLIAGCGIASDDPTPDGAPATSSPSPPSSPAPPSSPSPSLSPSPDDLASPSPSPDGSPPAPPGTDLTTTADLAQSAAASGSTDVPLADAFVSSTVASAAYTLDLVSVAERASSGGYVAGGIYENADGLGLSFRVQRAPGHSFSSLSPADHTVQTEDYEARTYAGGWGDLYVEAVTTDGACVAAALAYPARLPAPEMPGDYETFLRDVVLPMVVETGCQE